MESRPSQSTIDFLFCESLETSLDCVAPTPHSHCMVYLANNIAWANGWLGWLGGKALEMGIGDSLVEVEVDERPLHFAHL